MKKLLFLSFAIVLAATSCSSSKKADEMTSVSESQTPPPTEQRGQRGQRGPRGGGNWEAQAKEMATKLNLSEAQAERFEQISLKYREKMQAMRQESGGDRMAMREKMQAMRSEQTAEVKGILTAEQFTTYEQLMDERQKQRRKHRGGNGRR